MIDYIVKNKAKLSPNYLILVLDEFSTKIISNYCELWDLMQNGNIYQIERLDKVRKRYPMSDALYFIHPSSGSIDKILEDFP
jgi:ABC-type polysaccharide/polyol phosphate transport system ATPase subunit